MDRSEVISAIRRERLNSAEAAEGLRLHLRQLAAAVDELQVVRGGLLTRITENGSGEGEAGAGWAVAGRNLQGLDGPLREVSEKIMREDAALERAIARLSRPTLNIGMVGHARMGKSRFLQSLTGLGAEVIPDGAGGFCTGVPSLILHSPGPAHAYVYFHSPATFLAEVISPYYATLRLDPAPLSVESFRTAPLPALPDGAGPGDQAAYDHLASYHRHLPDYADLLTSPSPRRVEAADIRRYVAQDDAQGARSYQWFRAVRRVHVSTAFLQDDLDGIGVIDLPGLGDTNLGDSRVLLAALKDDVDIVLFLRKPDPGGDALSERDIQLYALARNALPEIPMEERSFLVLNRWRSVDRDNEAMAGQLRDRVGSSPVRVVQTMIADCSAPAEVAGAFEPVIEYLLGNVGRLDKILLAERVRQIGEIQQELRLLLADVLRDKLPVTPDSTSQTLFNQLFRGVYTALNGAIEGLQREYKSRASADSSYLAEAVVATIKLARASTGIPAPEEIAQRLGLYDAVVAAYSDLLAQNRAHLSRHFLQLEDALMRSVEQMRDEVAAVLLTEGQLSRTSELRGREFLSRFADSISGSVRLGRPSEVKFALEIIGSFQLSYRSFIQHRIRHCLDGIQGMQGDRPRIELPKGSAPTAEEIHEALVLTYEETLSDCEQALNDLLKEPNLALFGIVEEFRDRVLRSEGVEDEWRSIYYDVRADIWQEKFSVLEENSAYMRTWHDAVSRVTSLIGEASA